MNRHVLTCSLLLAAFALALPAAAQNDATGLHHEVLQAEADWYKAFAQGDEATIERLEADDFRMITTDTLQIIGRQAHLAGVRTRKGQRQAQDVIDRKLESPQVRTYGDISIVNAIQTIQVGTGADARTWRSAYTGVWRRQVSGAWQIVNAQWTDYPSAPTSLGAPNGQGNQHNMQGHQH